jgi:Na+/H+ antiporter NhaD/arsenite permease-like protein
MVSTKAIVTLLLFIISIIFVIVPVHIPLPKIYGRRFRIPINLTTAPIATIAILWAAGCIGPGDIRDGIVGTDNIKPYNILILFFSLAYMAITLDITGVLQAAAFWVSNKGGTDGRRLYLYFYIMLTLISMVLGNDPVILSGTVFLVYYTKVIKLDPMSWLIAEFAAANTASMVLFVGNPTNVVICEGFLINNVAFSAYTIPPFIACSIFCYAALRLQFAGEKYIPKRLPPKGHLDPRSALHDPVGAWVGSLMLGACLAVILIVSFFGVDVWKITLPFAVAKFVFDLSWDYYRHYSRLRRGKEDDSDDALQETDQLAAALKRQLTTSLEETLASSSAPADREKLPLSDEAEPNEPNSLESSTRHLTSSPHQIPASLPPLIKTELGTKAALPAAAEKDEGNAPPFQILTDAQRARLAHARKRLHVLFPTFMTALPRLPFALVPFAFSQFILIEGLAHQGWIARFAEWLVLATARRTHATVWLVGVLGVVLCNGAGTNIGATILLTKVMRGAALPPGPARAGAIALAVASNVGAVSFTFSASLAGLLWRDILRQKGINIRQRTFAFWNLIPIVVMTSVGLGVVSAEMAILYKHGMI